MIFHNDNMQYEYALKSPVIDSQTQHCDIWGKKSEGTNGNYNKSAFNKYHNFLHILTLHFFEV